MKQKINFFRVLAEAGSAFMEDKVLKMSASLAYYTIFSIAPLLILIISLAGLLYGQAAIEGRIFQSLNDFLGSNVALQIQEMIKNISLSGNSVPAFIISIIILLVGATGVFVEIQDSINDIWRVKAKPKKGLIKLILNRFISFSLIIGLGFLLIVSLIINGLIMTLSEKLSLYFPEITIYLANAANILLTFIIITLLFGIIYKFLPDVRLRWRQVRSGAVFTTLLFMLGHYLFGLYVSYARPGLAYGAAGSLVLILLWVYYNAVILYFGAEFTRVYLLKRGEKIYPSSFAVPVNRI